MGGNSGGLRGGGSASSAPQNRSQADEYDANDVANTIRTFAVNNRDNRDFNRDLMGQNQSYVAVVASANLGLASDVAKTVMEHGYNMSEKQAYIIASAIVNNGMIRNERDFSTRKQMAESRAREANRAQQKKEAEKAFRQVKRSTKAQVNDAIKSGKSLNIKNFGEAKVVSSDARTFVAENAKGERKKFYKEYVKLN